MRWFEQPTQPTMDNRFLIVSTVPPNEMDIWQALRREHRVFTEFQWDIETKQDAQGWMPKLLVVVKAWVAKKRHIRRFPLLCMVKLIKLPDSDFWRSGPSWLLHHGPCTHSLGQNKVVLVTEIGDLNHPWTDKSCCSQQLPKSGPICTAHKVWRGTDAVHLQVGLPQLQARSQHTED